MAGKEIRAGKAFLELTIRDTAFAKGLTKAAAKLRSFGTSLTYVGASISAAGAAIIAPFAASLKVFADVGSELHDMSAITGIAVDKLSLLKYAAEQSGTSLSAIRVAAKNMQKNGLDPNLIADYVKEIGAIQDPVKRAQAAMKTFGARSGTQLLSMIKDFDQLQKRFEELGGKWTPEMAAAADALGDSMGDLKVVFAAVSAQVAAHLAPIVTRVAMSFAGISSGAIQWVRENKVLVLSVAGLGAGLLVLGAAMSSFGIFAITAGAALSALVAVMAALTTPTAIIASGVALLIGLFVKFTNVGQQMAAFLAGSFQELLRVAGETFAGIGDALAAGDIQAAANVLWAGLKLAWLNGTEELRVALASFKNDALNIFVDLSIGIERVWVKMTTALRSIWTEAMGGLVTGIDLLFTRFDMIGDSPMQKLKKITEFLERQGERDKITQPKLKSIEEERKARLKDLDELAKAADNVRDEQKDKDIKAAAEAATAAQKAFDDERNKAAAGRAGLGGKFKAQFNAALGGVGGAAISSPRSILGGRLAEQVFGAGSPDDTAKQQLKEQKRARIALEKIERQKAAAAMKVGGN